MEELKHKVGLRVVGRVVIFEKHFNLYLPYTSKGCL